MSAVRNDDRYRVFLERMPINKFNVTKSALEAGFGKSVAETQQKRIMAQALKYQLQNAGIEVKSVKRVPVSEAKRTMAEIVGFSKDELLNNLKWLGTQEKDLSVRLKVIAPLARDYGVVLDAEEKHGVVPVLNVTVRETTAQPSHAVEESRTTHIVRHEEEGQVGGGGEPSDTSEIISTAPPL